MHHRHSASRLAKKIVVGSFRQRLFFTLGGLACGLLVIVTGLGLSGVRQVILHHATAQLEAVANHTLSDYLQWLDQGREVVRLTTELPTMRRSPSPSSLLRHTAVPERMVLYDLLRSIVHAVPDVRSISMIHPTTGVVLLSTDRRLEMRVRLDEPYFQAGKHTLYVSPVVYSVGREAPILTISAPLNDMTGHLQWVIAAEMNLDNLHALLGAGLGQTVRKYLVDAYGFYIISPPYLASEPLRSVAESEGVRRVLTHKSGTAIYFDPHGDLVLGIYRWLQEGHLGLLVEQEQTEITREVMQVWILMILGAVTLLVGSLFMAHRVAGKLVSPLQQVTEAAQALRAGNLSYRTLVRSEDELGHLGMVFNEMAEGLQQSYESLSQAKADVENILTTMNESLFVLDTDGMIQSANRSAALLLGYAEAELVGLPMSHIMDGAEEDATLPAERLIETGALQSVQKTFLAKDGRRLSVLFSASAMRDPEGGLQGVVCVAQDISQRVEEQQARQRLITDLEAKNAELERYTYTVSHDLKSPLVTVQGFLGLLAQDLASGDTERIWSDMAYIQNATDTMGQLLEDLLRLSRIGRAANTPAAVALGDIVQETVTLLDGHLSARGAEIVIDPDLPVVWGDRLQIGEIFQNLLENAVKFSGKQPTPRITVGVRQGETGPICYVQDNGIGIAPAYHDKVFGLFERLDVSTEGTGVGLALVKRIIEVHGGRIWIESEDQGTTFCFSLPLPDGQMSPLR